MAADKTVRMSESRGHYPNIVRIGRPVVYYDQRTTYKTDLTEYDRTIRDRKKIGHDEVSTVTAAPVDEDL